MRWWNKWRHRQISPKVAETAEVETSHSPNREEISYAVLRECNKTLRGWSGFRAYLEKVTNERLDADQAEINRIREWAKTAELNFSTRWEYNRWLDHFQCGLNEAREEVRTHHERDLMQKYREENRALFDRVDATEIPRPPQRKP